MQYHLLSLAPKQVLIFIRNWKKLTCTATWLLNQKSQIEPCHFTKTSTQALQGEFGMDRISADYARRFVIRQRRLECVQARGGHSLPDSEIVHLICVLWAKLLIYTNDWWLFQTQYYNLCCQSLTFPIQGLSILCLSISRLYLKIHWPATH